MFIASAINVIRVSYCNVRFFHNDVMNQVLVKVSFSICKKVSEDIPKMPRALIERLTKLILVYFAIMMMIIIVIIMET